MKNLKFILLKSLIAAVAVVCLTVGTQAQDSKMDHKKMSKMNHTKGKMSKMSPDKTASKNPAGKM